MNRFEGGGNRLAVIEYLDGDFRIVQTGSHVICAMTGKTIPVDEPALLERGEAGSLCGCGGFAGGRKEGW